MSVSSNIQCAKGNAPLARRIKNFASLAKRSLLDLYSIETTLHGEPLKILLADDGMTLSFFQELLTGEESSISRKGRTNVLTGPGLLRSGADLVVVGVHNLLADRYANLGFRIIPKWVRLLLPVDEEPLERLLSLDRQSRKYFKWMLNKVEKAGFECEMVWDLQQFDRFYREMYVPYAHLRFGDSAVIYKYSTVREAFMHGALLLITKDGKPISGTVIHRQGDILRVPYCGVATDGLEIAKEGAAFASDLYLARYAHSQGCAFMDLGYSRPFFSDGTLRFKLNWHTRVVPDESKGVFAVAAPNLTPQAEKFLSQYPHFHLAKGECVKSYE